MPKKNTPNPFLMFMLEIRSREEAKGRKFRGMEEIKDYAGKQWEKMDAKQRAPYAEQAKVAKLQARACDDKLTGVGTPFSSVAKEKCSLDERNKFISNSMASMVENAAKNGSLDQLELCFVSMGYFCELSEGTFIPAELAAIRYSLREGVIDRFHTHINPGTLPLGYAYAAQAHSEMNHKLPIPPNALGEKDYDKIATKFREFLSQFSGDEMPLLFTNSEDLVKIDQMLADVMNDDPDNREVFVCPLKELFYHLKKTSVKMLNEGNRPIPSMHALQVLILKDVYDYSPNISCDFHDNIGDGKYCALSQCIRWAFVISDSCCTDLRIPMKPGKHLPENADTEPADTTLSIAMNNLSFATRPNDTFDHNISRITYASASASAKDVPKSNAWETSKDTDVTTSVDRPIVKSLGRGFRPMVNVAAGPTTARAVLAGRGRGTWLMVDKFPPLGSTNGSFK
ncbi:AGAP002022-PA-like protein [Anopheles sinensis]|uniref:AGAP002022-PA-like protein n=1 Tax=Anopheles sinensis TaxID=74873 RepID=A0A084VHB0_ANOSI|nr:AGAP002022-PA-like protein [Anopheles sinensis]